MCIVVLIDRPIGHKFTRRELMSDPSGNLPSGVDPSDPGAPNDSSLGADRAAAIAAEKEKWRNRNKKATKSKKAPPSDADLDGED